MPRGCAQKQVNEKLTTAKREGMFQLDPLDNGWGEEEEESY